MSESFGRRPCELALGEGYSVMEGQMFDLFVFGILMEEKEAAARRQKHG